MINKDVNGKRLIAFPIAVIFCVAWLSSSGRALEYDPAEPRPWVTLTETPHGDEGGWNDPTSIGRKGSIGTFGNFQMYIPKYFIIYFIPKDTEHRRTLERNDLPSDTRIDRSRGASSE